MTDLRIWVGVLADYNGGRLHGRWYDLDDHIDSEELEASVRKDLLVTSRFPNVEIDCPFCGGDGIDTNQPNNVCAHCHGEGVMAAAEEWAIFDHEGFPDGWVGQYTGFSALYEMKEHLEDAEAEFGNNGLEIVEAFHHCFGTDHTVDVQTIRDAYRGEYRSGAELAEEFYRDTADKEFWEGPLACYINWERVWEGELEQSVSEHNGHYFWSDWR